MACKFETGLCREARVAGGVAKFADLQRFHYMQANVHLDVVHCASLTPETTDARKHHGKVRLDAVAGKATCWPQCRHRKD